MRLARGLIALTVLGCAVLAAGRAQADPITLDFTSGTEIDGTGGVPYQVGYVQDGFALDVQAGDHFEVDYGGDGRLSWHDGASSVPPNVITLYLANGSGDAFHVYDVDVTSISHALLGGTTADPGGILFTDSNGNSVTATSTGVQTLNFSNTTYLTIQTVNRVNTFPISIDDLRVDTLATPAVPEPGTLALFGLGSVGLAAVRRRRRAAA